MMSRTAFLIYFLSRTLLFTFYLFQNPKDNVTQNINIKIKIEPKEVKIALTGHVAQFQFPFFGFFPSNFR